MTKRDQVAAQQEALYGYTHVLARRDLESGWKAAKAVAAGGRLLGDAARHCLLGRMAVAGVPPELVASVMDWDERAGPPLARLHPPADGRGWVLYEGLSVAMAEGGLEDAQLDTARTVAAALDLAPEAVDEMAELCRQEWDLRMRRLHLLAAGSTSGYRFDLL